jgi:uncharacterized HAD superfamily protein
LLQDKKIREKNTPEKDEQRRKMKIAFDLDGVLVNLMEVFDGLLHQRYGKTVTPTGNFHITVEGISEVEVADLLYECIRMHDRISPFPYASELLKRVHEVTDDVITIVTARPKVFASETFFLVDRICPVPYRISMVESHTEKINHLRKFDAFVEDRRKTAFLLADAGKTVFLVNRPYNVCPDHPNIRKIEDLGELLSIIEKAHPIR